MESGNFEIELAEIKKQLSRQKKVTGGLAAIWIMTAAAFLMGAASTGVTFFENIKVKRLALVDSNGIERLILEADNTVARINGKDYPRKSPVSGIIIQNVKGDEAGGIGTSADGGAAIVLDSYSNYVEAGAVDRIGFVTTPEGTAAFLMNDLKQQTRALITTDSEMNVKFQLFAEDGRPRISGEVSEDGKTKWSN